MEAFYFCYFELKWAFNSQTSFQDLEEDTEINTKQRLPQENDLQWHKVYKICNKWTWTCSDRSSCSDWLKLKCNSEPVCDASRLDVFDEDALTAASCRIQTDHAETQTSRQRPNQTDQVCVTALHTHTHTHTEFSLLMCLCASYAGVFLCVCWDFTYLGSGEDPFLQEVRRGRSLMDGRRWAIGQDGGGGGQGGCGWASVCWINSAHDQLTLFGETELAAGIRRHTAQLQEEEEEDRFVR